MPTTATLTVSFGLAAREVDFSQGPAIRLAAPALLRKLRRSVISVFSFVELALASRDELRMVDLEPCAARRRPSLSGCARLDIQVVPSALPQVFEAKIIQPCLAFDDDFGAFNF